MDKVEAIMMQVSLLCVPFLCGTCSSVSICLSVSLSFCPYVCPSVPLSFYVSVSVSSHAAKSNGRSASDAVLSRTTDIHVSRPPTSSRTAPVRSPLSLRAGCLERLADLDAYMARVDEALTALQQASSDAAAMDTDDEPTGQGRNKRRRKP